LVESDAVIAVLCALVGREAFPYGSFDLASCDFLDRDRFAEMGL